MSTTPSASPQPSPGGPAAAPATTGSGGKVFLWILGGCLGIMAIGILIFAGLGFFFVHKAKQMGLDPDMMQKNPVLAVAKISVAANPDLETVSSNDSAGTIVVHNKKTGKTSTMQVDPDKRIMVITDEDGKTVTMKLDSHNKLVVTDDKGKTTTISGDGKEGSLEIKGDNGNLKLGGGADKAPDWVPAYGGVTATANYSASNDQGQSGSYSFVTNDNVDKVMSYYSDALKTAGLKVSNTTVNSNGKSGGIVSGTSDADQRTVMVTLSSETDGTHVGVTYNAKKQQN
ncbi:MAG TPA: hypothetical protein VIX19_04260 [Terriglobales bacterium]